MDILRVLESGFILKTSPDHKGSVMSIEISQTNNNIFVIGSTDLNARVWDIRIGNFVQNHVVMNLIPTQYSYSQWKCLWRRIRQLHLYVARYKIIWGGK